MNINKVKSLCKQVFKLGQDSCSPHLEKEGGMINIGIEHNNNLLDDFFDREIDNPKTKRVALCIEGIFEIPLCVGIHMLNMLGYDTNNLYIYSCDRKGEDYFLIKDKGNELSDKSSFINVSVDDIIILPKPIDYYNDIEDRCNDDLSYLFSKYMYGYKNREDNTLLEAISLCLNEKNEIHIKSRSGFNYIGIVNVPYDLEYEIYSPETINSEIIEEKHRIWWIDKK